jgi:hypothetical protein
MTTPTPTEELTAPELWLTLTEGARHARAVKPDGRVRDSFYKAIKRHIGDRRLVRASELDALIAEGKL